MALEILLSLLSQVFITERDECDLDTDNCDQVCTNTDGSYTCSCNSGFTLDADGHSCTGTFIVSSIVTDN